MRLGRGVRGRVVVFAAAAAAQVRLQRGQAARQLGGSVGVELDDEDGAGVTAQEIPQPGGVGVEFGAVEDVAVHDLDGGRTVGEDGRHCGQRVEQVGELHDEQRLRPRQLHQPQFRLQHDAERAFRADEQLRQVERGAGPRHEGVKVVAAHAAQDFRITAVDFRRVLRGQLPDDAVTGALLVLLPRLLVQLHFVQRPQFDNAAVRQQHAQLQHMVDGLAMNQRVRAGRIVGDHAAEGGAIGGGDVRRELQAERLDVLVEVVQHAARLNAHPGARRR